MNTQQAASAVLSAALAYASRGWYVFPVHTPTPGGCSCHKGDCGEVGKHPRTMHGLKDATADVGQIEKWWRTWPDANVAVRTGKESGVWVLDVDPRHRGDESFDVLVREKGKLPETVESLTGGGGRQLFFAHAGDVLVKCSESEIAPGIDVRGDGGYVVLPPSLHASGRRYEWEASSDPLAGMPIAAAPAWLVDLVKKTVTVYGPAAPAAAPASLHELSDRLAVTTLRYLAFGAPVRARNTSLFKAACDLAGNGLLEEQGHEILFPRAIADGLEPDPVRRTIHSAWSQPRNPGRMPDPEPVDADLPHDAGGNGETAGVNGKEKKVVADADESGRAQVSNVIDSFFADDEGEKQSVRYYVPIPAIARQIAEASAGWPRRASGGLFVVRDNHKTLPDDQSVQWIKNADDLLAWVGSRCDVRWASGDAVHPVTKNKLNPPSKREMYAYLKDSAEPAYRGVEILPHVPPVPDIFYLPCRFPQVPLPPTPLSELVSKFNAETEEDRFLMFAALLTPGWGGPPGARPAFVFTSDHGRGVGKTTTAAVLAEVWGGATMIGVREEWDKIRGRLLSDSSLAQRVVVMDNIKGRLHGSEIEGLITASVIDGWKPYVGQASRPNLMTWYLTSNVPTLSRDLADRAVVIKVGKKRYDFNFLQWAPEHIRRHRAVILAEIYEILAGSALSPITRRDRWGSWQDAILSRFDNGDDLAKIIADRRPMVDADLEDANAIADAIIRKIEAHFPTHKDKVIRIEREQMRRMLVAADIVERNDHPKVVTSVVKNQMGTGDLTFLEYRKAREGDRTDRFWFYRGPDSLPETKEEVLVD